MDLTKKGAFRWIEESDKTFNKLKEVMSSCPVLALPYFSQTFVLDCDALGEGIGLFECERANPFESQKLQNTEKLYSIYDKEMLDIMHALEKFR